MMFGLRTFSASIYCAKFFPHFEKLRHFFNRKNLIISIFSRRTTIFPKRSAVHILSLTGAGDLRRSRLVSYFAGTYFFL